MQTFNLTNLAEEADNQNGDFKPEDGAFYEGARIKHAQWSIDKNGNPSWFVVVETVDGSFPVPLRFGSLSFANKRVFDSLRAVGYTDFANLNPEVATEMMKNAIVNVKVKWGKNKKNPDDPWANHVLSAPVEDIPEKEEWDEDDDY